jgi:hypothetical protein
MARSNRDLLVTFNSDLMSQEAMEQEIAYLHELLTRVERMDNLIVAHELIDMNRYKITRKSLPLRMHIRSRQQPPFVFLSCLN